MTSLAPKATATAAPAAIAPTGRRIVNMVNFVRYDDHRHPGRDLLEPLVEQMRLLKAKDLPCTWLLQFDALTHGPYVPFLKGNLPASHEVGLWFEINRIHCDAAGVPFRGEEGLNWDHHAQASLSVGYTQAERERLVDVAVSRFREIFGFAPRSVGAWYIDAFALARFSDKHGIQAFVNCRDQYGTDGYTLWGGWYSGGYYPSRRNALSPGQSAAGQIPTPMFRMLGSDPIHQYDINLGEGVQGVRTLETIYKETGKNPEWVRRFLDIVGRAPTLSFSHVQAGQENSFGWANMAPGYTLQVDEIARRRDSGELELECLADTGAWFRKNFATTPAQSVVALDDTTGGERRSIWYNSLHYRVNLLIEGDRLYLRDFHLFDESYAETHYRDVCDHAQARFDTLPVLDGYGWSDRNRRALGAWNALDAAGRPSELALDGVPQVEGRGASMTVAFPLQGGRRLRVAFDERGWEAALEASDGAPRGLALAVRWAEGMATSLSGLAGDKLSFSHAGHAYGIAVAAGTAVKERDGWTVAAPETGKIGFGV